MTSVLFIFSRQAGKILMVNQGEKDGGAGS